MEQLLLGILLSKPPTGSPAFAEKETLASLFKGDGVPEISAECENEIFSGSYRLDNFKLRLDPEMNFQPIIEAVRDKDDEVWLELSWESLMGAALPVAPVGKYGAARRRH